MSDIREYFQEQYPDVDLLFREEKYDDAIVGVASGISIEKPVVAYDFKKLVDISARTKTDLDLNGTYVSEYFDSEHSHLLVMTESEYDKAIIGVLCGEEVQNAIVYDYHKVIQILMDMGMDYEGAVEYHEFNQAGAYVGPHTPVFIETLEDEDEIC